MHDINNISFFILEFICYYTTRRIIKASYETVTTISRSDAVLCVCVATRIEYSCCWLVSYVYIRIAIIYILR